MPSLVVTSLICRTIRDWKLDTSTAVTQSIAHDREVCDVDGCLTRRNSSSLLSVNGSLRAFDFRSLQYRLRARSSTRCPHQGKAISRELATGHRRAVIHRIRPKRAELRTHRGMVEPDRRRAGHDDRAWTGWRFHYFHFVRWFDASSFCTQRTTISYFFCESPTSYSRARPRRVM
jgi:hypothetical protein